MQVGFCQLLKRTSMIQHSPSNQLLMTLETLIRLTKVDTLTLWANLKGMKLKSLLE